MTPATTARRRGRRPGDAAERRARVARAVAEMEEARVPFTMADVAERAGISRATLYRDAGLRALVGSRGDGPAARPVNAKAHAALQARVAELSAEARKLRHALRLAEKRLEELEFASAEAARSARAQKTLGSHAAEKVRTEAYAEGFAAGARAAGRGGRSGGEIGLVTVAARLPRPALLAARRTLARALHPDLFAKDPATALLATELLKQINALAGGSV